VQYALTRYCTLRITTSWDASVGLELRNVAKRVGAETYIHETSVRLAETGFSILLGPTLAGKTTLMQLMAGLDRPTSGEVWLGGRDVTAVPVRKQVEAGVAVAVGEFLEDLREVRGMLLLQQIQQVGGRPDAQETPDGVEDEVDSALRRHGGSSIKSQTTHFSTDTRYGFPMRSSNARSKRSRSATGAPLATTRLRYMNRAAGVCANPG